MDETKKEGVNMKTLAALVVVAILIIGALSLTGTVKISDPVLATVNGVEIKQSDVDERVEQIMASPQAQFIDTSNPEILAQLEESLTDELVNTELLLGAARDAGFSVTEEEIQEEYDFVIEELGGADILAEELARGSMSDETFRQNIHDQLVIAAYLESVVDPTAGEVTDEEIEEFYNTQVAIQDGAPPLDEIRLQLSQQIGAQKQQAIIGELITDLRDNADIVEAE